MLSMHHQIKDFQLTITLQFHFLAVRSILATKYIPKKLLPTSPIKILAGGQFQNRKVNNEPKSKVKLGARFNLIFKVKSNTKHTSSH